MGPHWSIVLGVSLVAAGYAAGARSRRPPDVVQVRRLELVNDAGAVVGRLATTPTGAELVLGGRAQASLVTDGELAAANLVGREGVARLVAADEGHLVLLPPSPAAPEAPREPPPGDARP